MPRNSAIVDISPAFGSGSGLKQVISTYCRGKVYLPGLRVGERIETTVSSWSERIPRHLPGLRVGERIETSLKSAAKPRPSTISPAFGVGERIETLIIFH